MVDDKINEYRKVLEEWIKVFRDNTDSFGLASPMYGNHGLDGFSCSLRDYIVEGGGELSDMLGGRKKVILVIADALGISTILSHWSAMEKLLENARVVYGLSSTAPTTTATALATLSTGAVPAKHGMSGFKVYLREIGSVVEVLGYKYPLGGDNILVESGVEATLIESKTIYEEIRESGEKVYLVAWEKHIENKFTAEAAKGAELVKHSTISDTLSIPLELASNIDRGLVVTYWGEIDSVSHIYGPYSKQAEYSVEMFASLALKLVRDSVSRDVAVIIIADHGQISVGDSIRLDNTKLMQKLVIPPFGEKRLTYLVTRETLTSNDLLGLEEKAVLLERKEYPRLFGDYPSERFLHRFGDYILVPTGLNLLVYPYSKKDLEDRLKGHHGGLLPEELAIPCLIFY